MENYIKIKTDLHFDEKIYNYYTKNSLYNYKWKIVYNSYLCVTGYQIEFLMEKYKNTIICQNIDMIKNNIITNDTFIISNIQDKYIILIYISEKDQIIILDCEYNKEINIKNAIIDTSITFMLGGFYLFPLLLGKITYDYNINEQKLSLLKELSKNKLIIFDNTNSLIYVYNEL